MKKTIWKEALILGGTTTALAFARSLGKKGVPVNIMASSPLQPAMHTRLGKPQLIADPVSSPEECLDDILTYLKNCPDRPILIPTLEEYVKILDEHREDLEEYSSVQIPRASLVQKLLDKQYQYELLEQCGLSIPVSAYSTDEQFFKKVAGTIGFPCVIKPCHSHIWRQVPGRYKAMKVNSLQELESEWLTLSALNLKFLAQEMIPGNDDCLYSYLGYYSKKSIPMAELTARKIRQYPEVFGTGSLIQSAEEPAIAEISRNALRKIGYQGHLDMEYKWDRRDQTWKFIEINLRAACFIQLAVSSGVDIPWTGYLCAAGLDPGLPAKQKNGVLFMNIAWDLKALSERNSNRLSGFIAWIVRLRRIRSFAVLNISDLKPAIAQLGRFPGIILKSLGFAYQEAGR